jgi:predicted nucleotidyltransferase
MGIKPVFYIRREAERLAYKALCITRANTFLSECKNNGIDVVIFGSLVNKDAHFRANSDIDICVFNEPNLDRVDVIANRIFKVDPPVKSDIWLKDNLKEDVLNEVLKNGARYVD